MSTLRGKKRHDYDVSFRRAINQLASEKLSPDDASREVADMIEGYLLDVGEPPSAEYLDKMSDAILGDDLREKDKELLEHAFLSESQIAWIKTKKGRSYREVPFDAGEIDSLYFSYADPTVYSHEIRPEEYYIPLDNVRGYESSRNRGIESVQRKWAMSVKERDGFRCKNPNCRSRAGVMHAHHIYNFADFPEKRTNVENGITLCETCHHSFHSMYGKERNTPEQLDEFLAHVYDSIPAV